MKIACVGNCQLETLAWYIKQLKSSDECKWISFNKDIYLGFQGKRKVSIQNEAFVDCNEIYIDESMEQQYLQSCDYLIYLKMLSDSSPEYHTDLLENMTNISCKTVSITNLHLESNNITESIRLMNHREQTRDVDIVLDDLLKIVNIEQITPKDGQLMMHPPTTYFLTMIQLICDKFNWPGFDKYQLELLTSTGFPYG